MPKFKDIDIPHLLHEFPLLVELGITGEKYSQALAFLNLREQQDKRVLISLAIHELEWPHHASAK